MGQSTLDSVFNVPCCGGSLLSSPVSQVDRKTEKYANRQAVIFPAVTTESALLEGLSLVQCMLIHLLSGSGMAERRTAAVQSLFVLRARRRVPVRTHDRRSSPRRVSAVFRELGGSTDVCTVCTYIDIHVHREHDSLSCAVNGD